MSKKSEIYQDKETAAIVGLLRDRSILLQERNKLLNNVAWREYLDYWKKFDGEIAQIDAWVKEILASRKSFAESLVGLHPPTQEKTNVFPIPVAPHFPSTTGTPPFRPYETTCKAPT